MNLILIKVGREGRILQIDMRYKLLVFGIPQMQTDIRLDLIPDSGPTGTSLFIRSHLQEMVDGDHKESIVINIQTAV